jgi:hypothetical protein
MTTSNGPIDVLLIEDDPGDELMTREAFAQNNAYVTKPVDFDQFLGVRRPGYQPGQSNRCRNDSILLAALPQRDQTVLQPDSNTDRGRPRTIAHALSRILYRSLTSARQRVRTSKKPLMV